MFQLLVCLLPSETSGSGSFFFFLSLQSTQDTCIKFKMVCLHMWRYCDAPRATDRSMGLDLEGREGFTSGKFRSEDLGRACIHACC